MDRSALGIDAGYWDVSGTWHESPAATIDAVATAMGAPSSMMQPTWFVRSGTSERLHGPAEILLEGGAALQVIDALPPDLPLGYHRLVPLDGGPATRLVVTPGTCHLPADLRMWGLVSQLPATRSARSWGIGDLGDLHRLGRWAAGRGAGVVAVSPLHAPGPASPVEHSPYYPSSRRFLNPLHIRVEAVPGAAQLDARLEPLAAAGRALTKHRHIDRDKVWALKREAFARCFAVTGRLPEFERFALDRGASLLEWATYCAIADEYGNDWRRWPFELRRPDSPQVADYAVAHRDTVRFHSWLQWVADAQLAVAASSIPLLHDLAVGFEPGGADAWAFQDQLALEMRVGAPPDEFNPDGQEWGLPPFVPWRLTADGYRPIIETLRAVLRHAGGLRVDHVMGLFRLFWVPPDGGPAAGAYVRSPAADLLDVLALESHRAGAFIVGEDLGTVEDGVREELQARNVLSYRLLWFEDRHPSDWPLNSLGAVTTHDLATIAGLWTGVDPAADEMAEARDRLARVAELHERSSVEHVVVAAHRVLAEAASRVVVATLEDALGVAERPNLPGTVDDTNWSMALPKPLEEIEHDPLVAAVVDALREHTGARTNVDVPGPDGAIG